MNNSLRYISAKAFLPLAGVEGFSIVYTLLPLFSTFFALIPKHFHFQSL